MGELQRCLVHRPRLINANAPEITTTMKRILAFVSALALSAYPAVSEVQTVNLSTTANGSLTNAIPAASTTSTQMGNGVNISQYSGVSLQVSFSLTTTNAGDLVLTFARSASQLGPETPAANATYETASKFTWTIANTSTNATVSLTNLPATFIGGVSAIKLVSAQNTASAGVVTNLNVLISRKR